MKLLLEQHFNTLKSRFKKNLEQLSLKSNPKNLHALRVTIKRLHALLLLSEYLDPTVNAKKSFRKFKKMFSEAGKLRTLQVHAALVTEFSKGEKYAASYKLKKKIQKEQAHLKKHLTRYDAATMLRKIEKPLLASIESMSPEKLEKGVDMFITENLHSAMSAARKNSFHKSRKKLKNAHYMLELNQTGSLPSLLLKTIDPIEKNVGRWHDLIHSFNLSEASEKKEKQKTSRLINLRIRREITVLESKIRSGFRQLEKRLDD